MWSRGLQRSARVHIGRRPAKTTPGQPFPKGCQVRDLTAQEKAVEFLLFDLTSCVQPDDKIPEPPPINYRGTLRAQRRRGSAGGPLE